MIDIDYEIEENEISDLAEIIKVYGSNAGWSDQEELDAGRKKYKKEFSLDGDDSYYVVSYTRNMLDANYQLWKSKRHTGMSVSWYYNDTTVQPDQTFLNKRYNNKEFIALVNAVHENRTGGLREELKRKRQEFLNEYPACNGGRLSGMYGNIQLPSLPNISVEPIYTGSITQDTLNTAGRLYFDFREGFIEISKLTALKSSITKKKSE